MKTWLFAVVGTALCALAGCRSDPAINLLERQNRMLEDEVYRLQAIINEYESGAGPSCGEIEGVETIHPAATLEPAQAAPAARSKKATTQQTAEPPTVELPSEAQPPGVVPESIQRPAGTIGPDKSDKSNAPEKAKQPEGSSGPFLQGPPGLGTKGTVPFSLRRKLGQHPPIQPVSATEPIAQADSKDVRQLVLNRALTGGYNDNGQPGDSGVRVVLETRDAKGRRLEAPADVSVVLLDPAKPGDEARFARWDFAAGETAKLIRGDGVTRGMYIECPWPDSVPEHNRLHVFVRYATRDGRKLQADQHIEINLPGEHISQWMPAKSEKQLVNLSEREFVSQQSDAKLTDFEAEDSSPNDISSGHRSRSRRTDWQDNATLQNRPVWSPERE